MAVTITPGALVRHPDEPDWGLGQVQSVIGPRITVNFQHRGKVMVFADVVALHLVDPEEAGDERPQREVEI